MDIYHHIVLSVSHPESRLMSEVASRVSCILIASNSNLKQVFIGALSVIPDYF